jgi:ferredoxin
LITITVDYERCESFGMCCLSAPDLFQIDDDDQHHYAAEAPDSRREDLLAAASQCPTRAITLT